MSLAAGTRLGAYEITAQLGAGGMGEVYRATDSNLKRSVAIKVLPASVAGDADRLARFQREAEVLAALNHPNIASVYGLEKTMDLTALVMELVEGEDLSQRIARGAIPLDEALPIAKQIAEALEAAHEQGIIHRDLKPANVKVRPDGTVKVLDFGLAKAMDPGAGSREPRAGNTLANSPTITSPAMTRAGIILGTAAYMAPEQAKGKAVDKRADIWAFGVVLFEMLAGRRAFAADGLVGTLSAVTRDHPDWSALPADTPASLGRLLQRLLEKDPKRRMRDMGDVRIELDALDAAPETASSRRTSLTPWIVAAALGGVAAGAVGMWATSGTGVSTASPQVLRVSLRLPPDQRLVVGPNEPLRLAISPDGTRIVYVANDRLYLRALDAADASPLANTEGATSPFFSPDGESIAFAQKGKLVRFSLSGSVGVPLADVAYMVGGRWGDDGGIVFGDVARGIFRVENTGGTVEQLMSATEPGQIFGGLDVLPGGDWVLYGQSRRLGPSAGQADFETIAYSRKTKERRVLLENGPARYMGNGYLFYHGGTGTFVVPFDPARAQVTGQAVAIRMGIGMVLADISSNGTFVYTTIPADARRMPVWMTGGGTAAPLPIEPATYRFPRVSPNGRHLAVSRTDRRGLISDVWLHTIDGTSTTRLTFDGKSGPAVWTSDGRRIAVSVAASGDSKVAGTLQLFVQEADGTGRAKRVSDNRNNRYPYAWFAGNTKLLFIELGATALDVGVVDTTNGKEQMLLSSAANETRPDPSPDGQWLAYTSNESGRDEIYVRPLHDVDSGKWQVSTGGGHSPVWLSRGREIAYRAPGKMMIVTVQAGTPFRFDAPRPLFDDTYVNDVGGRSYDVGPDGRFLMLKDDESSVDQIEVIVNWFEEMRRLMQAK